MQQYIREPAEIYKKSFDTITSEVDLTGYNDLEKKIVTRIIHSCGDVSIAEDIFITSGVNLEEGDGPDDAFRIDEDTDCFE